MFQLSHLGNRTGRPPRPTSASESTPGTSSPSEAPKSFSPDPVSSPSHVIIDSKNTTGNERQKTTPGPLSLQNSFASGDGVQSLTSSNPQSPLKEESS